MRIFALVILAALAAFSTAINVPVNPKISRVISKTYETVHPQVVRKTRPTRNAHSENLDIKIATESGETFTLQLTLNNHLIAPQFSSMYYEEDGKAVKINDQVNCFYHGQVLEHPEWMVAMDSCQGLRGSFGDASNMTEHYNVEPLSLDDVSLEQPHALFLVSDSEEEAGECGTKGHSEDNSNPLELDEEDLERVRRQSPSGAYIVELYIVNDNRQYRYYGNDISRTVSRALALINVADRTYRSVNIRLVAVHMETWTTGDRITVSSNPDTSLQRFRTFSFSVQQRFDAMMLITGADLQGNTVGIAFLNTMCGSASVGVIQDRHSSSSSTGSTFAHEVGHLLNMEHDTSRCSCSDPSRRCVMAAVSTFPAPTQFSSCSRSSLQTALRRSSNNLGRCLGNEPATTVGQPVCGNGIREGDEICDCGSPQECDDPCCDARTCRMAAGAQCTKGECCSSTCQFKAAGTSCRSSSGQCDIEEYCSGESAECPADVYYQDGTPCNSNQAYCFSGECQTYNKQCQYHFRSNKGADECFRAYNPGGNYFGNCGSDGTNFIRCAASNVMCGQLFCQPGSYQNHVNSVYILEVGVRTSSGLRQCVAFTPPATSDVVSPGLVEDGIKCGNGKLCYEQRCVTVSSLGLPQCPRGSNGLVCSGRGACNNKGQCSCNVGFGGDTCQSTGTVNECLNNNGGCDQICIDRDDSFECRCRDGYTLHSDGTSCIDVNECTVNNGGCQHTCVNTDGSYECRCRSGYVLSSSNRRTCTDVNECSEGTHNCDQVCTNTVGSFTCSCNSGYVLEADGRSCRCGGTLTGASGSFQTPGWPQNYPQEDFQCEWIIQLPNTGATIGFTIDTSAYGINGRSPCSNDYIQFFDGTGSNANSLQKLCQFQNPGRITTTSSQARVVFAGTANRNRPPSRVGVKVDYVTVQPTVNLCSINNGGCDHTCVRTANSYECQCRNGYSLSSNERSCNDVNECSTNNGGCQHSCVNTDGSYECRCRSGYTLSSNGRTCTDINECLVGTHNCAQVCTNTAGSFTCSCNSGFTLAADGRSCTEESRCGGTLTGASGSFQTPGWPQNYPQENFQCEWIIQLPNTGATIEFTIDDSAYGINGRSPCSNDYIQFFDGTGSNANSLQKLCQFQNPGRITTTSSQARVLFVGSASRHRPASRVGVKVDYVTVQPTVDPCSNNNGGCEHTCVSTANSYQCQCRSGYRLSSNGRSCTDVNECSTNNGGCQHSCVNTDGSYECRCRSGYRLSSNGRTCTDVNECNSNNGGCQHNCVNTDGSYECRCRSGYRLSNNGRTCTDINECSLGTHNCDQVCTNTAGSFTCSCNNGFTLAADGRSCTEESSCGGRLTGASGSFQTPEWPTRYPQEDFQCEWIIELPNTGAVIEFTIDDSAYGISGRSPCANDYIQFFDGTGSNANSLHKLCQFQNPGPITTTSSQARVVFAGSINRFRPASRVGVRVTYRTVDIDECALGTHNCEHGCVNTDGSFRCICNDGYSLAADGRSCECGGTLTAASGSFQTPEWPDRYPQEDFQCEWTIEIPNRNARIEYTIQSPYGINGRPPCSNDYIEFFDGTNSNAQSMHKLCRFDNPGPIRTTSSQGRVIFQSSVNQFRPSSRVGVKVNYRTV